jgi:hypothetical protein
MPLSDTFLRATNLEPQNIPQFIAFHGENYIKDAESFYHILFKIGEIESNDFRSDALEELIKLSYVVNKNVLNDLLFFPKIESGNTYSLLLSILSYLLKEVSDYVLIASYLPTKIWLRHLCNHHDNLLLNFKNFKKLLSIIPPENSLDRLNLALHLRNEPLYNMLKNAKNLYLTLELLHVDDRLIFLKELNIYVPLLLEKTKDRMLIQSQLPVKDQDEFNKFLKQKDAKLTKIFIKQNNKFILWSVARKNRFSTPEMAYPIYGRNHT